MRFAALDSVCLILYIILFGDQRQEFFLSGLPDKEREIDGDGEMEYNGTVGSLSEGNTTACRKGDNMLKLKEAVLALALLGAVSALCLKGMQMVGEHIIAGQTAKP